MAEAETNLNQLLDETGKKEELREKLLEELSETGWRDQVRNKSTLNTKFGLYFHFSGQVSCS